MWRGRISRGVTGLAAGALLGAALLGALALGTLLGRPNAAFSLFEWLTRVLPGRVVIFGLETTLRALEAVGLSIKDASKATEEALVLAELFVASAVAGLVFFAVTRPGDAANRRRRGTLVGAAAGLLMVLPTVTQGGGAGTAGSVVLDALWVVLVFIAWGWALGRLFVAAYPNPAAAPLRGGPEPAGRSRLGDRVQPAGRVSAPAVAAAEVDLAAEPVPAAEVTRMDRRHFIIRVGGLVATFVVLGAEVAEVLRVAGGPAAAPVSKAPIPFPNADSPVKPAPGYSPRVHAGRRALPGGHRPHSAEHRRFLVAAAHLRPGRSASAAHHRPAARATSRHATSSSLWSASPTRSAGR